MKRIGLVTVTLFVGLAGFFLIDPADQFKPESLERDRPQLPFAAHLDQSGVVTVVGDIADCERATLWNRIINVFDGRLAWVGIEEDVPPEAVRVENLIERQPGIVLALGDIAYPDGELRDFECFGRAWGNLLARTYPTPGNHEYKSNASGYRAYWGARAGPEGFFYSLDYSGWHLVALNSEIEASPGSAQAAWLEADLTAHGGDCILAFDHRPAFSARARSGDENAHALFEILNRHGATLFLSGHNHFYERTAPLNASGAVDENRGIRQFVVGTGGAELEDQPVIPASFTEALVTDRWGELRLDLENHGYAWTFIESPDGAQGDAGHGACVSRT